LSISIVITCYYDKATIPDHKAWTILAEVSLPPYLQAAIIGKRS